MTLGVIWVALTLVLFPVFYIPIKLWDMHKVKKNAKIPTFEQMLDMSPAEVARLCEKEDE